MGAKNSLILIYLRFFFPIVCTFSWNRSLPFLVHSFDFFICCSFLIFIVWFHFFFHLFILFLLSPSLSILFNFFFFLSSFSFLLSFFFYLSKICSFILSQYESHDFRVLMKTKFAINAYLTTGWVHTLVNIFAYFSYAWITCLYIVLNTDKARFFSQACGNSMVNHSN